MEHKLRVSIYLMMPLRKPLNWLMPADNQLNSSAVISMDLPNQLNETFDVVFTSYGTIGWLPDLDKWANVIRHFLKPGGQFIFADFHPSVWMFDDDFKDVSYNYFNDGPIVETQTGTYGDKTADFSTTYVMWNHGIAEIFTALTNAKLRIEIVQEFDYSPYDCFRHTEEFEPGKFRIQHLGNRIPMVLALNARKYLK
jgi:SAM-dependent methyltransferase